MKDHIDNTYGMDLSFIQNMSQSEEEKTKETILRFEPLSLNTKSIKLTLYNTETGEKVDFDFDFDMPIKETKVKYIFDKDVPTSSKDVKIKIDNVEFSSAGSTINYTINSLGSGYSIMQLNEKNANTVVLEEDATTIKKMKKYPAMYSFNNDKLILSRMDFNSIEDLNNKVYFSFENLFKAYPINRDVLSTSLTGTNKKENYSFDVGNYKIVIEGLGFFNDQVVLVLHGEDKNIKFQKDKPNANRVEVRLDAQVVATTSAGVEIILDGKCTSAQYGTDMIFPITDSNRDLIYGMGAGNIKLRIASALVKIDDNIKFEFDLKDAKTENDTVKEKACDDIVDAFEKRLAYKSGEKSVESVIGFDEKLKKKGDILAEYAPVKITEKAE